MAALIECLSVIRYTSTPRYSSHLVGLLMYVQYRPVEKLTKRTEPEAHHERT